MSEARTPLSVDWFADVSCPWCYVGWAALKQAAAQRPRAALSVAWRSFLLHPDMPAEGVERAAVYARLAADNPKRFAATREALVAAAAAAEAPLDMGAAGRMPRTVDAHRLIHWAAGQGLAEAAIDAVFDAYFAQGLDIGGAAVLTDIAEAIGLDHGVVGRLLAGAEDVDLILRQHEAAVAIGVQGVPAAIFARTAVVMGAESADGYAKAIDAALAA